jgi:hypothetical protein
LLGFYQPRGNVTRRAAMRPRARAARGHYRAEISKKCGGRNITTITVACPGTAARGYGSGRKEIDAAKPDRRD